MQEKRRDMQGMTSKPTLNIAFHPATLRQTWHAHLWTEEEFFSNTDDYFTSLLTAIDEAKHSIILATYIFDFDALGHRVVTQLGKAQQRGVVVRVLIDGIGCMYSAEQVVAALSEHHIDVRIYHPLPWQPDNTRYALPNDNRLVNAFARLLKINQRHHAKLCIVDKQQLWAGSQNISVNHMSADQGGHNWRDYGARVSGSAVANVANLFDDFWFYRKPHFGKGRFRYYWNNVTAITRRQKNRLLTAKIYNAKQQVWIINPYFSPTRSIMRALRQAGKRGVDVRLIVPNKSDIGFFPALTATYYRELIKASVRVFEYLPSILHAKLIAIDDFRLIGSTNLNHRSLLHDIEFDIVLESDRVKAATLTCFLNDQSQSREIIAEDLTNIGWRRLFGWIPWLLRYWL